MKWSGVIILEMELILVEVHTEIRICVNKATSFIKKQKINNGTKWRNEEKRQLG